ncbi:hypothetical protein [Mesorhizobium sp. M0500]|uniref:hypothetical protein n=1 Tax=Mesorhizobium sp. M0500 TaxID=2956953 RepID=UPI003339EE0C
MRGEVLHYDEDQGFGFITGADGNRYTLAREDLRREASVAGGTTVEFQPAGGRARDVFSIRAQPASAPLQPPRRLRPAMRQRHVSRNISAVPLNKVRPNRPACGTISGWV